MRVPPFYSPLRGIAVDEVWHDNDECPIGQSLALTDRLPGMSTTRQRCQFCALLDSPCSVRLDYRSQEREQ